MSVGAVRAGVPIEVPPGEALPHGGLLEELDGTPIEPARTGRPAPALSWPGALLAATAVTATRPHLWVFALVAFLARGGVAVLVLPIVVLPTFIGIANFVGPASVTAGGPAPRLVALIALGVAAGGALVVIGTLLAAAAETVLHRATVAPDPGEGGDVAGPGPVPADAGWPADVRTGTARIAAVRLALLVPVALVVALAVPAWVAAAYRELTLPSDVATPLVARVLGGAPAASVAVLAAWLVGEVAGGFAARRAVLLDVPAVRALAQGLLDTVRYPVGTILTTLAALAASVVALVPAVVAVGAAWDAVRGALAGGADPVAAFAATLLLVVAWVAAFALAGIAAAWRATLATAELLRRPAAAGDRARLSPSGAPPRHDHANPPVA